MHKFSVSKDMNKKINNDKRRKDMIVGKVVAHLCLTLIIKELKFSVEHCSTDFLAIARLKRTNLEF